VRADSGLGVQRTFTEEAMSGALSCRRGRVEAPRRLQKEVVAERNKDIESDQFLELRVSFVSNYRRNPDHLVPATRHVIGACVK